LNGGDAHGDAYALHDVYVHDHVYDRAYDHVRAYVRDHDDAYDLRYVYALRDDHVHDDVYVHGGAWRDDHVRVCGGKNAIYGTIYPSRKFCAAIQ